jgi:hypothetical protein
MAIIMVDGTPLEVPNWLAEIVNDPPEVEYTDFEPFTLVVANGKRWVVSPNGKVMVNNLELNLGQAVTQALYAIYGAQGISQPSSSIALQGNRNTVGRGRPKSKIVREMVSARLHPDTVKAIADYGKANDLTTGRVIDQAVRLLKKE